MFNQFEALLEKFNDIERQLSDPEVISDQKKYQSFVKKHAELKEGVALYQRFKKINSELKDARTLLKDPAFSDLAKQEIQTLEEESQALQKKLELFLIPPDPHDKKNAVVEIRAGTGGEEAALFAYDLFRMYTRYASRRSLAMEAMNSNPTELGGFKEIIFEVIQEADGGFVAECLTESIFTQGDTWEGLRKQVRDAVEGYFFDQPKPKLIRLHFVRDEVLAPA